MACRYAGIDWATQSHDVLVADEDGSEVLAGTYRDAQGRNRQEEAQVMGAAGT